MSDAALYRAVMAARFIPRPVQMPRSAPVPQPRLRWSTPIITDVSGTDPIIRVLGSLPSNPTIRDIQVTVASVYGVTMDDLMGPSRQVRFVVPRHVAMILARFITGTSLPEIGFRFNRDHTCVVNAIQKYGADIAARMDFQPCPPRFRWTEQQNATLREMWRDTVSVDDICDAIGRTKGAIYKQASTLKLGARQHQ